MNLKLFVKEENISSNSLLNLAYDMSGGKLSVVRDLFDRILFAYVIGNNDMHLKNISLIRDHENRTAHYDRLAPNYDCLFTTAFDNASMAGSLALDLLVEEKETIFSDTYLKYGFYTGADFGLLGNRDGLRDPAVHSLMNRYFSKEKDMLKMVENSFMPSHMKKSASDIIRDRMAALKITS